MKTETVKLLSLNDLRKANRNIKEKKKYAKHKYFIGVVKLLDEILDFDPSYYIRYNELLHIQFNNNKGDGLEIEIHDVFIIVFDSKTKKEIIFKNINIKNSCPENYRKISKEFHRELIDLCKIIIVHMDPNLNFL